MRVRVNSLYLAFALIFWPISITSQPATTKPARLAVFKFLNETQSADYDYLQSSVSESLIAKMRENFEFTMPNRARNQKLADALLTDSKAFTSKQLKGLCYTADVDYAIFGSLSLPAEGQITVLAGVYSVPDDEIITFLSQTFETNSTMFQNMEALSTDFIHTLRSYVSNKNQELQTTRRLVLKEPEPEPRDKENEPKPTRQTQAAPQNRAYVQALGYGLLGSLNYEFSLSPLFAAGAGAGYLPVDGTDIFTATLFFSTEYWNIPFKIGPYFVVGENQTLGFQTAVGYRYAFQERYFVEPAFSFLWTPEATYPFAGLSFGITF